MRQIKLEIGKYRKAFDIPNSVKEVIVDQAGNKIVVEMVPEKVEPKPGDVMINEYGSVYIFKSIDCKGGHNYFVRLGSRGRISYNLMANPGRPATPEEAQPLWDALKKAGKKWNPETMQVGDLPEIYRIRLWVEENLKVGRYDHARLSLAISMYLDSIVTNASPIDKLPADKRDLYAALPDVFSTSEGADIAENFGIAERTYKRFLNKKELFQKVSHGIYEKLF